MDKLYTIITGIHVQRAFAFHAIKHLNTVQIYITSLLIVNWQELCLIMRRSVYDLLLFSRTITTLQSNIKSYVVWDIKGNEHNLNLDKCLSFF